MTNKEANSLATKGELMSVNNKLSRQIELINKKNILDEDKVNYIVLKLNLKNQDYFLSKIEKVLKDISDKTNLIKNAIKLDTIYYLTTSKSSGVTKAISGWSTFPENPTKDKKYTWAYHDYTHNDESHTYSNPVIISIYSEGIIGEDGVSYIGTTEHYYANNSSTAVGIAVGDSNWKSTIGETSFGPSTPYLWNYETIIKSNGSNNTSPQLIAHWSKDGKTVKYIKEFYIANSTLTCSTTIPMFGKYDSYNIAGASQTSLAAGFGNTNIYLWNVEVLFDEDKNYLTNTGWQLISHWGIDGNTHGNNFEYHAALVNGFEPGSDGWHPNFQLGDAWMRTISYNEVNGQWDIYSNPMKIVGENGNNGAYYDYQFARSSLSVSEGINISPTGIDTTLDSDSTKDGWNNEPIGVTTTYPYLWMKMIYVNSEGTSGTPSYICITGPKGENATSYVLSLNNDTVIIDEFCVDNDSLKIQSETNYKLYLNGLEQNAVFKIKNLNIGTELALYLNDTVLSVGDIINNGGTIYFKTANTIDNFTLNKSYSIEIAAYIDNVETASRILTTYIKDLGNVYGYKLIVSPNTYHFNSEGTCLTNLNLSVSAITLSGGTPITTTFTSEDLKHSLSDLTNNGLEVYCSDSTITIGNKPSWDSVGDEFLLYYNGILVDSEVLDYVKDGTSKIHLDLTNELDSIFVGTDKVLDTAKEFTTLLNLYDGSELITSNITYDKISPTGITVTLENNVATILIPSGYSSENGISTITFKATYKSKIYEATYKLILIASGIDGVSYNIIPVEGNTIKVNKNNLYSIPLISFKITKSSLGGIQDVTNSLTEEKLSLKVYKDNIELESTSTYNTSGAQISFIAELYYNNDVLVDSETIPIIIDGLDGIIAYTLICDNDTVIIDDETVTDSAFNKIAETEFTFTDGYTNFTYDSYTLTIEYDLPTNLSCLVNNTNNKWKNTFTFVQPTTKLPVGDYYVIYKATLNSDATKTATRKLKIQIRNFSQGENYKLIISPNSFGFTRDSLDAPLVLTTYCLVSVSKITNINVEPITDFNVVNSESDLSTNGLSVLIPSGITASGKLLATAAYTADGYEIKLFKNKILVDSETIDCVIPGKAGKSPNRNLIIGTSSTWSDYFDVLPIDTGAKEFVISTTELNIGDKLTFNIDFELVERIERHIEFLIIDYYNVKLHTIRPSDAIEKYLGTCDSYSEPLQNHTYHITVDSSLKTTISNGARLFIAMGSGIGYIPPRIRIRNLKLEVGEEATPWCLAEEDKVAQSIYTSTVFKRSSNTLTTSDKPTGGSFAEPFNVTGGWTDGIPSGTDFLWMSKRRFTSDGKSPLDTNWSTPQLAADSNEIDTCFHAVTSNGSSPSTTGLPHGVQDGTDTYLGWYDATKIPEGTEMVWMAMSSRIAGSTEYTPWNIIKIKGEDGSNGDIIQPNLYGYDNTFSVFPNQTDSNFSSLVIHTSTGFFAYVNAGATVRINNVIDRSGWYSISGYITPSETITLDLDICDDSSVSLGTIVKNTRTYFEKRIQETRVINSTYHFVDFKVNTACRIDIENFKIEHSDDLNSISTPYNGLAQDSITIGLNILLNSLFNNSNKRIDNLYLGTAGIRFSQSLYGNEKLTIIYFDLSEKLQADTYYTLSFYTKTDSLNTVLVTYIINNFPIPSYCISNGLIQACVALHKFGNYNLQWKRCTYTFKTSDRLSNCNLYFVIANDLSDLRTCTVEICMPKLEVGEKVTPWCLAEEDKISTSKYTKIWYYISTSGSEVSPSYANPLIPIRTSSEGTPIGRVSSGTSGTWKTTIDYQTILTIIDHNNSNSNKWSFKVWKVTQTIDVSGGSSTYKYSNLEEDTYSSRLGTYSTYIGEDGIYSGTIAANLITAGSINGKSAIIDKALIPNLSINKIYAEDDLDKLEALPVFSITNNEIQFNKNVVLTWDNFSSDTLEKFQINTNFANGTSNKWEETEISANSNYVYISPEYTISGLDSDEIVTVSFELNFILDSDTESTTSRIYLVKSTSSYLKEFKNFQNNTEVTKYKYTFKWDDTYSFLRLRTSKHTEYNNATGIILIRNFKLEKGTLATQWCLSESDKIGLKGDKGDNGLSWTINSDGYWVDPITGRTTIKAEGKDGTSVKIIGNVNTESELPTSYNGDIGDGYITNNNGHLHSWTGTGWNDCGVIKGDKGNDATLYYIHFVYCSNKDTGSNYSSSVANTYMGTYVDTYVNDAESFDIANAKTAGEGGCISSIVWAKIKGATGSKGATGTSVISVEPEYLWSSDDITSDNMSGYSWSTILGNGSGNLWERNKYIWSNGGTTYSNPLKNEYAAKLGTFTTHIGSSGIYTGTLVADKIVSGKTDSEGNPISLFTVDGTTGTVTAKNFIVDSANIKGTLTIGGNHAVQLDSSLKEELTGTNGSTPYIGSNGNWWIDSEDTGYKAVGTNGTNGTNGKDGETPHIGKASNGEVEGYWYIGSTNTGVKAVGTDGTTTIKTITENGTDVKEITPLYIVLYQLVSNGKVVAPNAPITPNSRITSTSTNEELWTTVIPRLGNIKTVSDVVVKACYVYTCNQIKYQKGSETPIYTWTTPILDRSNSAVAGWCVAENNTYIDGENIYTGTISANAIKTDTAEAKKLLADLIIASGIKVGDEGIQLDANASISWNNILEINSNLLLNTSNNWVEHNCKGSVALFKYNKTDLQENDELTISFDIDVVIPTTNESSPTLYYAFGTPSSNNNIGYSKTFKTHGKKRIVKSFTITSDDLLQDIILLKFSGTNTDFAAIFRYRNLKLEKGNTATQWCSLTKLNLSEFNNDSNFTTLQAALDWLTSDSTENTTIGKNFVYTGTVAANQLVVGNDKQNIFTVDSNNSDVIIGDDVTVKFGKNAKIEWSDLSSDTLTKLKLTVIESYYASSSNNKNDVTSQAFQSLTNALSNWNETNKYLWNKEVISVAGSIVSTTYHIIAIWTKDGNSGKGILEIKEYYVRNTGTAPNAPIISGENINLNLSSYTWEEYDSTKHTPNNDYKYLWNVEVIKYTTGDYFIGSVHLVSIKGDKGENATSYVANLTNEMSGVACDASFKPLQLSTLKTTASLMYGTDVLITQVTNISTTNDFCLSDYGITYSDSAGNNSALLHDITFTINLWSAGDEVLPSPLEINITLRCTSGEHKGATGTCTFTILPSQPGANGESPIIYDIHPEKNIISVAKNDTNNLTVKVYIKKTVGNTLEIVNINTLSDLILRYNTTDFPNYNDVGTKYTNSDDNISVAYTVNRIYISLLKRNADNTYTTIDKESIPLVKDGLDGLNGSSAKSLYLSTTKQIINCNKSNVPLTPDDIIITANLLNISGDVTWDSVKFNGVTDATIGTHYSTSGNTLTFSDSLISTIISSYKTIVITASIGELSDTITLCRVSDGLSGKDAYTIILTNEHLSLSAEYDEKAKATTISTDIIAYKGSSKIACTIGTPTCPTGITVSNKTNGTTSNNGSITFNVSANSINTSGSIIIPLTVDGKSFSKTLTYSLCYDGEPIAGDTVTTNTVKLYQVKVQTSSTFTTPDAPTNELNYSSPWKNQIDFNSILGVITNNNDSSKTKLYYKVYTCTQTIIDTNGTKTYSYDTPVEDSYTSRLGTMGTYIGSNGIYTGTLVADNIKGLNAGFFDAKIDTLTISKVKDDKGVQIFTADSTNKLLTFANSYTLSWSQISGGTIPSSLTNAATNAGSTAGATAGSSAGTTAAENWWNTNGATKISTEIGSTYMKTRDFTAENIKSKLIDTTKLTADNIDTTNLAVKYIINPNDTSEKFDVSGLFTGKDTIGGGTIGGWNITDSGIDKLIFTSDYGTINSSDLYPRDFSLIWLYSNSNEISLLKGTKYYSKLGSNDYKLEGTDAYVLKLTSNGLQTYTGLSAEHKDRVNTNQINTDGSGFLATKNIAWDTSGNFFIGLDTASTKTATYENGTNRYFTKIDTSGVLNTSNIKTTGGTIGGWIINSNNLSSNFSGDSIKLSTSGIICTGNGDALKTYIDAAKISCGPNNEILLNGDGSGHLAKLRNSSVAGIEWNEYGHLTLGHGNFGAVSNGDFNIKSSGSLGALQFVLENNIPAGKTIGESGLLASAVIDISAENPTTTNLVGGSTSASDTNGSYLRLYTFNLNGIYLDTSKVISTGNFYTTSDMRCKNIIEDVELTLNDIINAPSFRYTYKNISDETVHIGTSALYWQSICPELINEVNNQLVLDYQGLSSLSIISLARIIKELLDKINELEQKLNNL